MNMPAPSGDFNGRQIFNPEKLAEIHDCLTLALDATERPGGYTQPEREARSYMRTALRRTERLMGGQA